jgi:replicative DNA helicase
MKRLLRGVIDFEDGKLSQDALRSNYHCLLDSRNEWVLPEDGKVYAFVKAFFEHNLSLPSSATVEDYFTKLDDVETTERLKDVKASQAHAWQNYIHLVRQLVDDQNRVKMAALLKEAQEITTKGLVLKEGKEKRRLQGVRDALMYFTERVHDLIPTESSAKTRGNIRADTTEAWNEYVTAKHDKGRVWGAFTGIEEIDTVCHGLKRGEMWVHAAFAGELKSTMAMNWAYNLVTRYRRNVFYTSLEMPYEQIRRIICVMHSANKKFQVEGKAPLDYRKVRDGELSAEEEAFYQEVLKDFDTNPEYCRFEVWSPDKDVTIDDIRLETELAHKRMEVGMLVIDHGGLVEARRKNANYTVELNSVLRDAKKLALHFHGGEGVPVLMLFQINRDGKDMADKAEGLYKMRALSYANETERSADVISTTYLNDKHREDGTTKCCCHKNRDNPLFAPTLIRINFASRRMTRCPISEVEGHGMGFDSPFDVLDAL